MSQHRKKKKLTERKDRSYHR